MACLSDQLVKKAQQSWLVHMIPTRTIPIALLLAELGKDAVIRISNGKDEALEVSGIELSDLNTYVQTAKAYLKQADNRLSTSSSVLSAVSPGRPTSWHDSLFSPVETFAPAPQPILKKSRKKPKKTPTAFQRTESKRFLCPTCGKCAGQASDFKRHIQTQCEPLHRRYKCGDCRHIADQESLIHLHWTATQHSGLLMLPPISKKAFGCPYCGRCLHDIESYIACMRKDQVANENIPPRPTFRLRGLLKQSNTTTTSISLACTRRGLHPMDWTRLQWDDADCDRFASKLEYGCNASDDVYGWGVLNLDEFVEQLLLHAKFEDTGKPVPPPKDLIEPGSRAPQYSYVGQPSSGRVEEYPFNFGGFSNGNVIEPNGLYTAY